ncbi:MAG: leucine-rich repeat protein [Alistipes sp.]|nr:leucine-rich repeat protein [Alistipes sp.]
MKRFFLLLCLLLPFYLSAQTLKPQKHPEKELWGYWGENKKGKEGFVIKPKFEAASSFVDGHALVCRKSVWYVINIEGDEVAQMPYSNVDLKALNNRHFRVWQRYECGVVDLATLNEIIPVEYTDISVWKESFYKLHLGNFQGLADFTGKNILPVKYSNIDRLSNGVYLLELDGKYGLANAEGREILNVQYDDINPLSYGGFLLELGGKYGFADSEGREILNVQYDDINPLSYGGFLLKLGGKYGLANAEGKEILAADYDNIKAWTQDRLLLRRGNKYSLVDTSGKEVCKGVYYIDTNIYALISDDWSFANELGEPVDISDRAIFYSTNDGNALSKTMEADSHKFCDGKGVLLFYAPPTKIKSFAFQDCTALTSIAIPNNVTSIEDWAFAGCSSLTSITIPNSVTEIGWKGFQNCTALTSIAIPNSVKEIGEGAFAGCSSLTSITIPNRVKKIGGGTFEGCSSLTSITIPNRVTEINERAFSNCTNLSAFYGKFASSDNRCLIVNGVLIGFAGAGVDSYVISSGVNRIGSGAFSGCTALASIKIPDSVMEIGEDAFYDCTALPVVGGLRYADNCLVGGTNEKRQIHKIRPGTRLIAYYALHSVPVVNLVVPASVTVINGDLFYNAQGLISVEFQGELCVTAFPACMDLKRVTHRGVPVEFDFGWK